MKYQHFIEGRISLCLDPCKTPVAFGYPLHDLVP
jgi:hypothetical protein